MKAWSPGVAAADLLLSDLSADLYESKDAAAGWKEVKEVEEIGQPRASFASHRLHRQVRVRDENI